MRKRLSRLFFILGLLMVAAAALLILHNVEESRLAGETAESVLRTLRSASFPASPAADTDSALLPSDDAPESADEFVPVEIDGRYYIGILSIPSLELELPVLDECSQSGLKIAPCRYAGSVGTSDMVIAGHSYRTHFGTLPDIASGASVVLQAPSGAVCSYTVDCVEVLKPWQVEEMTCAGWDLTLFTCTATGRARFAVRCVRDGL